MLKTLSKHSQTKKLATFRSLCFGGNKRLYSQPKNFEVEIKFAFDPKKLPQFRDNAGETKFNAIDFKGEKVFTDVYYDLEGGKYPLTSNDIWMRRRQDKWECKVPLQVATQMDGYQELTEIPDIVNYLSKHLDAKKVAAVCSTMPKNGEEFEKWLISNGFESFGAITTTRRKFLLENEFTVDLDSTNFGYSIGEVELMVDGEDKVKQAEQRILSFCNQHSWFFDVKGKTMGKLLRYIYTNNRGQWNALVESGLVLRKTGKQFE